jgi:hypothetical protein
MLASVDVTLDTEELKQLDEASNGVAGECAVRGRGGASEEGCLDP